MKAHRHLIVPMHSICYLPTYIDENYTFPFTMFYSAFHTNTKQYFATLNFRKCILKQNL